MITIRLNFLAGRYHGTAWGRHVNEGVAEWPPSPYRLLRALYDVWQRKCPELSAQDVETALGALADSNPLYSLPSAAPSHTRSYLSSNSQDPTSKNLVFDGFVAVERSRFCYLTWHDAQLSEDARSALARLLENLNYLGRSESWVRAELATDLDVKSDWMCDPEGLAQYDGERIPVACAVGPSHYKGKRKWLDALTASTTEVLKTRASAPPLLREVTYIRPWEAVDSDPIGVAERTRPNVHAVVLGLDAVVLPLATAAIEIAEQVRVRLMGAHKRRVGDESKVSPLFSGKRPDGSKRLDHGHLYILPQPNSESRIDRILLLSRHAAFKPDELDAVRGVRELYQRDERGTIRCVVTWQGTIDEALRQRHRFVESATPFVTVRHWRKGRNMGRFLEDEIRRECRNHEIPEPIHVTLEEDQRIGLYHCIEYRRCRKDEAPRAGYRFRLEFAEPVPTPFSLGYGSHFGLGQFRQEGWFRL